MKKELIPKDQNSYLILDTNVIEHLIDAYFDFTGKKPWAADFLEKIKENNIQLLGTDLTFFEYLRDCRSPNEYKIKVEYLSELFDFYISGVDTADSVEMTLISNIYTYAKTFEKNKKPAFADFYLMYLLKNLSDKKVLLATFNYKDFPTLFLDREVVSIDFGKDVGALCIYKFNGAKFKKCVDDFMKAEDHGKKKTKNKIKP